MAEMALENEQRFIVESMLNIIIDKAAHILIDTPTVSEAPTDSFEEDFEPDFFMMDEDIKRRMEQKL